MDDLPGKGYWHIRNAGKAGQVVQGGYTFYNIPTHDLVEEWYRVTRLHPEEFWYISGMAPHTRNLLQGELTNLNGWWELYYSTVKDLPMREALAKEAKTIRGLSAKMKLRGVMNPLSYDWLEVLLDRYPGHAIEFSVFDKHWGNLPGYNTVFWEVRDY